ncbi:Serine protease, subtilisin family [Paenibacillus sp. UNCCL117]|uniref:S8 family serine peptidase n=1 Tax=unclassified Paenibacillus TaxID=185978 RepID=UPI00088FB3BD|nr:MULTISPECIES: S8 family serine peptidase [unclassified Paenibacillus]SDE63288.1 Serine protease, subtilisin family [Paenibacillus sp. cl123]SFW70157.1 Serine protease, subtilisin family [Paenibacillus sp. UNCCL117]
MRSFHRAWAGRGLAIVLAVAVVCVPGGEGIAQGQAYGEEGQLRPRQPVESLYPAEERRAEVLPGKVVVKYKMRPEKAEAYGLRSAQADVHRGELDSPFEEVQLDAGQSVDAALQELQQSEDVEYAEPVYLFRLLDTTESADGEEDGHAGPAPGAEDSSQEPGRVPEDMADEDEPVMPGADGPGNPENAVDSGSPSDPRNPGNPAGPGDPGMPPPYVPPVNDPGWPKQWGLTVTDVTYAWNHIAASPAGDGRKVRIAVLDTGVNGDHPDLAGQVLEGLDAVSQTRESGDNYGHGTKVAGIIAASLNNGIGIAGVAGGIAEILPVRVGYWASRDDYVIPSDKLAAGIYWAVKNGAQVINLSLGIDAATAGIDQIRVVRDAVNYALDHQVVVVAASGNSSNHWIYGESGDSDKLPNQERKFVWTSFPANMDGVLSVGAVTQLPGGKLAIADFSNIGTVTVVAPGTEMYTTSAAFRTAEAYEDASGTSFSAPFVSGLTGLLLAQNPALTPAEVRAIIRDSAIRPGIERPAYANLPPAEDLYIGGGLVSAKRAVSLPRLVLEGAVQPADQGQLSYSAKVTAVDDKGRKRRDIDGQIQLAVTREGGTAVSVHNMVYGEVTVPQLAASPSDYYELSMRASGGGGSLEFISSAESRFVKRPPSPIASLPSGSYTGSQRLTLTSEVADASIYYTINGMPPWPRATPDSLEYGAPLVVNGDVTLTAVAVKHGVPSLPVSFTYRITAGGGIGGGGGAPGGIGAALPVVEEERTIEGGELHLKPDKAELLSRLATDKGAPLHIDARSGDGKPVSGLQVELPKEVWERASAQGTPIVVEADRAVLTFPPHAVPLPAGADSMVLSLYSRQQTGMKPGFARWASPVYDLQLRAAGQEITAFAKPVWAEFGYDRAKLDDKSRSGVYLYALASREWKYAGGSFETEGRVRLQLDRFSRYAVMQWNRTFEDIQGHWAQTAIERLAARQIADGMTDAVFAPDGILTRAQFTALLARSLGLAPAPEAELAFRDVPEDSWYRDAVARAYAAGIVSGVSGTAFEPEAPITREQMAVMLVQARRLYPAGGALADEDAKSTRLPFADKQSISGWALEAVGRAAEAGLIEGHPDGTFAPREKASRAQAMTILHRLLF